MARWPASATLQGTTARAAPRALGVGSALWGFGQGGQAVEGGGIGRPAAKAPVGGVRGGGRSAHAFQPAAPRPRSKVWHLSNIPRLLPLVSGDITLPRVLCEECRNTVFVNLSVRIAKRKVYFFAKIGREQRPVTQEWTPERAAALITWWNEGICASEIGRRLSVTKNAVIGKAFRLQLPKRRALSPTQSNDQSVIRLERLGVGMCSWPLGATDGSGFHFCGSAAGETLLSDALQIGVSTGSQKPQGCCGRLMLGRERKPDSSEISPG